MEHQLVIYDSPEVLAAEAARWVAGRIRVPVERGEGFSCAVSGGTTPWAMFAHLVGQDLPWERVRFFQVDERVAPDGDPDRNLTHLRACLGKVPAEVIPMPVDALDLESAAEEYARLIPRRFDLVHLGLGPDGHTASLLPGDPVLEVGDRLVALTGFYQGHRRMTLTYPALARADQLLWLVSGTEKRQALVRLIRGDRSIPAGRVEAGASTIFADRAAAGGA